jgi:thymidine phosphorylase
MSAGVLISVVYGNKVKKGQTLARLYANDRAGLLESEAKRLVDAFRLLPERPAPTKMILEYID